MKESEDITIEKYYNDDIASIKDGVTENLISLKAIVVSVNEYPRYKFLIEEPGKITKVLSEEIKDTTEITDFKEIEEFEKEIMDQTNEGNGEESKGPIVNINNIVITLEDGSIIPEDGVYEGTKLKIEFDISVNAGTVVEISPGNIQNGKGIYITTGSEKDVTIIVTTQVDGETYSCKKEISLKDKYKKNEFNATEIAKKPTAYYGSIVTYSINGMNLKWRIFYADETNIYLISDNYISGYDVPKGPNGQAIVSTYQNMTALQKNSFYSGGSSWILGQTEGKDNSLAKKWLNEYLTKNPNSNNENIIAVAAMLDTTIWSKYANDKYAEYAIGGPTIEMYCASYKDTHPDEYIICEAKENTNGYSVKWNDGMTDQYRLQYDVDGIYVKISNGIAGMILASPDVSHPYNVCQAYARSSTDPNVKGIMSAMNYYGMGENGLRPVVCLKSEVVLEKQLDGSYNIINSSEN